MKSEEKFFGQVRKQKLSDAASIRSHRDSIWGTAADSTYSRPSCESLNDWLMRMATWFIFSTKYASVPALRLRQYT
jgi:hypothetical protein